MVIGVADTITIAIALARSTTILVRGLVGRSSGAVVILIEDTVAVRIDRRGATVTVYLIARSAIVAEIFIVGEAVAIVIRLADYLLNKHRDIPVNGHGWVLIVKEDESIWNRIYWIIRITSEATVLASGVSDVVKTECRRIPVNFLKGFPRRNQMDSYAIL